MVYTIGIKRRFFPGFKKYRVTGHRTQFEIGTDRLEKPRLVLTLEDESEVAVSDILNRDWILYGDFKAAVREREAEKAEARAIAEEAENEKLFREWLSVKPPEESAPKPGLVVPITKQA